MERSVWVEINEELLLRRPIDTSNTDVEIFLSYQGKNISLLCPRIRVGWWGRWLDVKRGNSRRMGKEIYRVIQNDCRGTIDQRKIRTKFGKQPPSDNYHSKAVRTVSSDRVRVYPGTEGTNRNRHWNHRRWHATSSLKRTGLSCWCL